MLVSKLLTNVNISSLVSAKLRVPLSIATRKITRLTPPTSDEEVNKPPERKLKEWRNVPEVAPADKPWWQMFDSNTKKKKKYVLIGTRMKVGPIDFGRWWKQQKINYIKHEQQFVEERHRILGCELAAAHFLVHRGGKVKFLGAEQWTQRNKDGLYELPETYDPKYQITHLDASGMPLYYEGIENFQNLIKCTWANFSNNPNFDDWCVDRLIPHLPNVKYLDISECKNISERALQAIYKLDHLKVLVITDFNRKPSFELSCSMLEECMPNLFVDIREPQANIIKDNPK
ncbi:distal membrane-arm assembly complex protein 2 [Venturia canescens]|uniref:distal membrane-arm assembly complex protein 2 n=1 Tax=Venturia canescens TaxID=32260 RepID=UPI001C9D49AF|nr:distal membrane-arm assembly complex protein 2 [Venturia canescens]